MFFESQSNIVLPLLEWTFLPPFAIFGVGYLLLVFIIKRNEKKEKAERGIQKIERLKKQDKMLKEILKILKTLKK